MSDSTLAKRPRVFISYSHDSAEHRARVLELSERLRGKGVEAIIDRYVTAPPEGWPAWMETQIQDADFVLLVFTETYKRRWEKKEEPGKGLGVTWEAHVARQALYASGTMNEKFIPVHFDKDFTACVPLALQAYTRHWLPDQFEQLYRHLTNQPEIVPAPLGDIEVLPPASAAAPLPAAPIRSQGVLEAEMDRLFDEGLELETKARQNGAPELALEAASRFRDVAGILDELLAVEADSGDGVAATRRAQRRYFLAQEQSKRAWYHYEKRELDDAEAASRQSLEHLEQSLSFLEQAKTEDPGSTHLIQKSTRWPIHRLAEEMMLASIRARRAWESGDSMTAMDYHRRSADLAAEAKRYADENKLDPSTPRILAGNTFTMQANAAQSAAKVFEKRGLEGDALSQIKCFKAQLQAYRLWSAALDANPEWRQPEKAMELIKKNLYRFIDRNRARWEGLYREFRDDPEFLDIMRELNPERFAEVSR